MTEIGELRTYDAGIKDPESDEGSKSVRHSGLRHGRYPERTTQLAIKTIWRLLIVAIVAVVWEYAVVAGWVDLFYASKPSIILQEFIDMVSAREFWTVHTYATFKAILVGMAIGTAGGILSALFLGRYDRVYVLLAPFITAIYSLPKIALAPLMILWFGIGVASKVALVVSVVYFIMFYNTHAGVQAVDRDMRNAVRMMGSSEAQLWRYVVVPSTTPWITAGLRVSMAFALTAAVVGELLASQFGLGNLLAKATGTFQTGRVFAILLVLGIIGVALYAGMDAFERRVLRWRGSGQNMDEVPSGV